jgi:hypothetical protein
MKLFKALIATLCIAFSLWIFASWCDVVADNSAPNPVHSDYNFFVVMFEKN